MNQTPGKVKGGVDRPPRVLMVSYVFPPMAAVGGYRTIKYCKFLPQFSIEPVVLTVKSGYNEAYDQSLLDRLHPSLRVYRSRNLEPLDWWDRRTRGNQSQHPKASPSVNSNKNDNSARRSTLGGRLKTFIRHLLSVPDTNNLWVPFGIYTGWQAIRKEKIDLIYSTSPPASTHLIGYVLSILTGRPLIVDFRDLWTQNESYELRNLPSWLRKFDRFLERRVLNRARAVITTTDSFTRLVRDNNPTVELESVFTIINGLDPDDFNDVSFPEKRNDRFTILHLGSLYGNRNPAFFFEALEEWARRRPEVLGNTIINFIGNVRMYEEMVAGRTLERIVTFSRHVPHSRILSRLWEANLLLLILGFGDSCVGVLPAKLFEYICTGRPILALVPKGEAEALINKYQRGCVISSPDIPGTCAYLDQQYDRWLASDGPPESEIDLPSELSRKRQAEQLSAIMYNLLKPGSRE